jgi:hypothetical protein
LINGKKNDKKELCQSIDTNTNNVVEGVSEGVNAIIKTT